MDWMENINTAIAQMTWIEVVAVITGIIYVILAAKENVWCWSFGIVSSVLSVYAMYVLFDLYIDAALYAYYVIIGFYGWYQWLYGSTEKAELSINTWSMQQHLYTIGGGIALSLLVGYFFATYTAAAATYLDAFTTVFSIIATVMVTRKVLENWLYWIVIDAVYVYLYSSRGGYLFAFLMVIYTIIAIIGYYNWRKEWQLKMA